MRFNKNGLKTGILAALLTITAASYAEAKLPAGTEFSFGNYLPLNRVISTSGTTSTTFTHLLSNTDFDPVLEGGEKIDIREGGQSIFEWQISPAKNNFLTVSASLDGVLLGQQTFTKGSLFEAWKIELPEAAYNALEDREGVCTIAIIGGKGKVTISSSTIGGAGVVVPEPASLLLLTSGLLALIGKKSKMSAE